MSRTLWNKKINSTRCCKINGKKTSEILFAPENGMVIQVGKGNVFKLKEQEKNKTLIKTL